MDWIAEYLASDERERRRRLVKSVAHYIYPTPIWNDGLMADVHPKTAARYAEQLTDRFS